MRGDRLELTGSATSTLAQGITLTSGCFAIGLNCVGGSGSSEFTDGGVFLNPNETNDALVLGASTYLNPNALLELRGTSTPTVLIFASSTPSATGDFLQFVNSAGGELFSIDSTGAFAGASAATSTLSGGLSLSGGNLNLATGGVFLINNARVLDATSLGTGITTASGLVTVSALTSGSLASGFGNISIGSSDITADVITGTGLANFAGLISTASSTFRENLNVTGHLSATGTISVGGGTSATSSFSSNINTSGNLRGDRLEIVGSATSTISGGLNISSGGLAVANLIQNGILFAGTSGAVGQDNGNLVFIDSTDRFGVATSAPAASLSTGGSTYLGDNSADKLTIHSGTIDYPISATTTISNLALNVWSMATSTTASPFLSVSTFLGTGIASSTSPGRIGIGTTTPEARLAIDGQTSSYFGVAGIDEMLTITGQTGVRFGNRMVVMNNPTEAANTLVGQFIRVIDDSGLSNTVRGLEIQAHSGTTTSGANTALRATGKTFGVQGLTTGTAGASLVPAGVYAENQSTSTGQVLRAYTSTTTTGDLALFFQEGTQNFSGSGLKMNFGKGTGPFTGYFLNLQANDVSFLVASSTGTIGIGTSTPFNYFPAGGSVQGVPSTHRGLHIASGAMATGTTSPLVMIETTDSQADNKAFLTMRSDSDGTPDIEFVVNAAGTVLADQSINGGGADLAEWFPAKNAKPNLEPGDLVAVDGSSSVDLVKKSEGAPYDQNVLGIISTKPGLISGGGSVEDTHENDVLVALAGRVPLKVSLENGPVKPGDRLTSSSIPGVAMKATKSGLVVGIALEAFDGANYLSEGTVGVETDVITEEAISTVKKKIIKDNRYFGADLETGKERGGEIEEVEIEEAIKTSLKKIVAPENSSAKDMTTSKGDSVKVGKVLVFVNLSGSKFDAELAGGSFAAVDQKTGKVTSGGILDMAGEDIVNVRQILSASGNWSINENGKLVVKEIQTDKLCIGQTCVTEAELKALLENAGVAPAAPGATSDVLTSSTSDVEEPAADTEPPVITINGNNPAQIEVGQSYGDLGATVTDNINDNLGIKISVDGVDPPAGGGEVQIDTSLAGEHTIIYSATDQAGNTGTATRIVKVIEP